MKINNINIFQHVIRFACSFGKPPDRQQLHGQQHHHVACWSRSHDADIIARRRPARPALYLLYVTGEKEILVRFVNENRGPKTAVEDVRFALQEMAALQKHIRKRLKEIV